MNQIRNFVKNTFKDVPKDRREDIVNSVTESLIEKVEDLVEKGLPEQQAIDQTVLEFGTVEDYFVNYQKKAKREKRQKTIMHYRNDLLLSIFGSLIIIGMLIFANLYYMPNIIWFVIPSIAVLWWPLAVLYNLLNKKENKKVDIDE
ncbi:MAG: hypothetical protein JXR62_04550 [Bacilli bacterium]|nr:hypothetical protein [Bacilli bacterium]